MYILFQQLIWKSVSLSTFLFQCDQTVALITFKIYIYTDCNLNVFILFTFYFKSYLKLESILLIISCFLWTKQSMDCHLGGISFIYRSLFYAVNMIGAMHCWSQSFQVYTFHKIKSAIKSKLKLNLSFCLHFQRKYDGMLPNSSICIYNHT